ncbi:radical SAM protein [Methanospirillum lacunae]|uniref:Radical SAM protein n=1 Tax=Methanospirillum lacunae TaxID=668570 RepID=A0A2V2N7Q1_9EURY|nr:radical SAM protein [Methanospirillum lacunae]PWR71303.1 radical SAM protein [Methanospirillum lacunae]
MFEKLLEKARSGEITKELALEILTKSKKPENALKLFEMASKVRNEVIGPNLLWAGGGIRATVPCKIEPRCKYCSFYLRGEFKLETIISCVKIMEEIGMREIHLVGGANLQGYDEEVLELIKAIRSVSNIAIGLNFGCSLSEDTIRLLKGMNIFGITIAIETINEELFKASKPGDSLKLKKEMFTICERVGMPIHAMLFVGLGGTLEDRINLIYFVKQFSHLSTLSFSRFFPFSGTPFQDHQRCSPWDVATTIAVARLVLPKINLSIAAGNTVDDIPLWYIAGGGNQIQGVYTTEKNFPLGPGEIMVPVDEDHIIINRMPIVQHYLEDMDVSIR